MDTSIVEFSTYSVGILTIEYIRKEGMLPGLSEKRPQTLAEVQ